MNHTPTSHAAQAGIDLDKHNVVQRLRDLLEGAAAWSAGETARKKIYAALDLLNGAASPAPETAQADDVHRPSDMGQDYAGPDCPHETCDLKDGSCTCTRGATGKAAADNAGEQIGVAVMWPNGRVDLVRGEPNTLSHDHWISLGAQVRPLFINAAPATSAADAKDAESTKVQNSALLSALRAVKEWDIEGWKERGFALPTELRARIQELLATGRKCWNCAEVSDPCYDGGTPWCTKCGVVDNPSAAIAASQKGGE